MTRALLEKNSRGLVVFDMDGTLVDDMPAIGKAAAGVIHEEFGTPFDQALLQYYSTTGKPFELQLRELYPGRDPRDLHRIAIHFREVKVGEVYGSACLFPEILDVLQALTMEGWVLALATGAERAMAETILRREGVISLFHGILGSGEGTKESHLKEYWKRWPGTPHVVVGDSRFDMEVAKTFPETFVAGRACDIPGWSVTPALLKSWGADWADYTLKDLPSLLAGAGTESFKRVGKTTTSF